MRLLKSFIALIFLVASFLTSSASLACTSFAVYGDKIFYGMNFDYPEVELQFSIIEYNGRKIFQTIFFESGNSIAVCGMNNSGVFSSIQMLYPQVTTWPDPKPNEMDLYQAHIMPLTQVDNLQDALNYIETQNVKVIHIIGTSLHDFFADKYKNALVLEVGNEKNLITEMENDFMIMTNFPYNQFVGKPLEDINGAGADRYKTAYKYIQANKSSFNFDNAIETLKRTIQTSGDFKSLVSSVFDPINNEVYVVLKRDFSKIWKVSIDNLTIETFSGFDQYKEVPLTSAGLLASELISLTSVNTELEIVPDKVLLNQNYPNPFNPSTSITYRLPEPGFASLKVFNIAGQEVATLVNSYHTSGNYEIEWQAEELPSGIYFYRLQLGGFSETKKIVLLE